MVPACIRGGGSRRKWKCRKAGVSRWRLHGSAKNSKTSSIGRGTAWLSVRRRSFTLWALPEPRLQRFSYTANRVVLVADRDRVRRISHGAFRLRAGNYLLRQWCDTFLDQIR